MTDNPPIGRLTARLIRMIGNSIAPKGKGDGRLCILNYHRILKHGDPLLESEPDLNTFRWHMQLLAECFHVMPLHEALETLAKDRMPPRAVCITFDDGYRSTHDIALPILKEFELPATVFVTTGHMGHGNMWNDIILEAIRNQPDGELNLQNVGLDIYPLETASDRKMTAHALIESTKYMLPAARSALIQTLEKHVGPNLQESLMLTREMIVHLAQNNIEIGGHTISHPILTRLDDEVARIEIEVNKRQLEDIIKKPISLFAYPNGKPGGDFDIRHVRMVEEAGYYAAFTTEVGAATRHHPRYEIPRSRPWDNSPMMFAGRLMQWLMGRNT